MHAACRHEGLYSHQVAQPGHQTRPRGVRGAGRPTCSRASPSARPLPGHLLAPLLLLLQAIQLPAPGCHFVGEKRLDGVAQAHAHACSGAMPRRGGGPLKCVPQTPTPSADARMLRVRCAALVGVAQQGAQSKPGCQRGSPTLAKSDSENTPLHTGQATAQLRMASPLESTQFFRQRRQKSWPQRPAGSGMREHGWHAGRAASTATRMRLEKRRADQPDAQGSHPRPDPPGRRSKYRTQSCCCPTGCPSEF